MSMMCLSLSRRVSGSQPTGDTTNKSQETREPPCLLLPRSGTRAEAGRHPIARNRTNATRRTTTRPVTRDRAANGPPHTVPDDSLGTTHTMWHALRTHTTWDTTPTYCDRSLCSGARGLVPHGPRRERPSTHPPKGRGAGHGVRALWILPGTPALAPLRRSRLSSLSALVAPALPRQLRCAVDAPSTQTQPPHTSSFRWASSPQTAAD